MNRFPIIPALCAAFLALPARAAIPRLVPLHDVTIVYTVHPRDHAPLAVHVSILGGGTKLRITSEDLPTAFLVDRPSETATILLPMLKLYATVGIGPFDPQQTILKRARFERHGQEHFAGHACTDWTAISPNGQASACITDDGVILRGTAEDRHGLLGMVQADHVDYGGLSPELFRRPPGYRNAGALPVDGLAGGRP
jgi:hypothetical protein